MLVSEIFQARQGEGAYSGTTSLFIRTSGCNLRCAWCDTRYTSWKPEGIVRSVASILDATDRWAGVQHVVITGGEPLTNGIDTAKTIGNFWPYATTIFDYTRRAMPWLAPRTLTDDQVYALTAYLLALNGIIEEGDVMNADTLPQVQMPNRDGFIVRFPERTPR